jgi:CheY-like chemotaxis protein
VTDTSTTSIVRRGTDARVLLVEDDQLIQQALGMALGDEGFDVRAATSGEEALAQLEREDSPPLDVILLDLMLPGMDDLEVCRTLRARGDLPIIIVTARTATSAGSGLRRRYLITRMRSPRRDSSALGNCPAGHHSIGRSRPRAPAALS